MSALAANRNTLKLNDGARSHNQQLTVKSGNTIYCGSLVAVGSDGYAVPASDASGLFVVGVATNYAEAGETVNFVTGTFRFANSTSHALTVAAHFGNLCYIENDQTVGHDPGSNSVKAGAVRWVDSGGVWVEVGNIRTT